MNSKKLASSHIMAKLLKTQNKEKRLEAVREKTLSNRGARTHLMNGFTSATMEAKSKWKNMFKVLEEKKKTCHFRILYAENILQVSR